MKFEVQTIINSVFDSETEEVMHTVDIQGPAENLPAEVALSISENGLKRCLEELEEYRREN